MRTVQTIASSDGPVTIIHDARAADVETALIAPTGWTIIRNPALQRTFLLRQAADPHTRLTLAVAGGVIAGRATVGWSFGRWEKLPRVREFGIEVARAWRRSGVAAHLVRAALTDPAIEDEILVAFTLPSAWDVEHAHLSPLDYGRLLATLAARYGFCRTTTDEPEVTHQFGAAFLVRAGANVPAAATAVFERARFMRGTSRAAA